MNKECCDTPRGFVGGICDFCEGTVQPPRFSTPETDAMVAKFDNGHAMFGDFRRFTEKLERERDNYKEMWESWRKECGQNLAAVSLLKDKRDQLVEKLSETERKLKEARDTARWLYQYGMATLVEGASRNEWIKEEIK